MKKFTKQEALDYHSSGRPGKIEVIPTKPNSTQYDLSLAYSPGVAEPCREIEKNPDDVYKYTAAGNLVAVISNGTAVLGIGDIGASASKPVMEGKGLLFKTFADVDVFDIEIDEKDPDKLVEHIKAIAPTFGGINLEDIKAPECFHVERRLKDELDIPVMHDDQHGTAIISGAGLLNALELGGKKIDKIKVVANGAGASAIACLRIYKALGVKPENIVMCDSKGVVRKDREKLSEQKKEFATKRDIHTLADAMKDADMFLGLSIGNVLSKDMVKSMASNPIIFAMANPDPEITWEDAHDARNDIMMATGRSDYPNQVNNVLGFPYIFRGALDVRATDINEEMKIAAVYALADLAKKSVPEEVNKAYNLKGITFSKDYIIPKPNDPRLITEVAPAVAKAAMESGVARTPIADWEEYAAELRRRAGLENKLVKQVYERAKQDPKRVVLSQADNYQVIRAALMAKEQQIAEPILVGNTTKIKQIAEEYHLDISKLTLIDNVCQGEEKRRDYFAKELFALRQRKGISYNAAHRMMTNCDYYGVMMLETGQADAFITGQQTKYGESLRPVIEVIGARESVNRVASMYIVLTKQGPLFLADVAVNREPNAQTLSDITVLAAEEIKKLGFEPNIAMLSYSNFGSVRGGSPAKVREAVKILHKDYPDLIVDGEMQANFALNPDLISKRYSFSKLVGRHINTLIFPNLSSGNIAYKLISGVSDAELIGPILLGTRKPAHVLQLESSINEIVRLISVAVVDAQFYQRGSKHHLL
ncbi:NADP-dependent malic enzyme [Salinivirga cyanobacteriivorans]|uniref:NADP-dependent malic enzyme n=1 Tax=Salinivirga cyanobacteriivorans TaxID=1307839 RepID=A0A0S2HXU0_9BACT|nr:NADP-dependent malic enzyme [Salinivirga cyanobacteriivorans]ALO14790.1 NADP-dependent malic enzyme [Salinivirga cyanobacteriivorans]